MRKRKGIRVCTKLMRSIEERIARRGDDRGEDCQERGRGRNAWILEQRRGQWSPPARWARSRRRCRTQEVDDADPWMSEVADRESMRARRPSPDLTSVRGCLLSREEQELPSRDGRRRIRRGEPGIRAYCGGSAGGVRRRGRGEARQ